MEILLNKAALFQLETFSEKKNDDFNKYFKQNRLNRFYLSGSKRLISNNLPIGLKYSN